MSNYVYSSSPHIKSPRTTRGIMIDVCIALLPSCIMGCVYFGWKALLILALATVSAVASEWVFLLCCKKKFTEIIRDFDFTSVVTGLLIGMNMYSTSKWYAAILASVFAIVIVKMLFGGTGKNIVNPAIAGRIFAFMAFGAAFGGTFSAIPDQPSVSQLSVIRSIKAGATPLQAIYDSSIANTLNGWDLLLGTGVQGCIGEVCKLALIVGGIYLIIRGVLNFRWPLVYILVTGVVSVIIAWIDGCNALVNVTPSFVAVEFNKALGVFLPSILSGGLILGAVFMATDYVTTPNTKLGNYIYFVLLGVLTAVMRRAVKGEVVSFVILLMNLLVPLIDLYIRRKPFGYVKPAKAVKEAK
ncbi:MAG: RnfABCDGE type electron transport complex subunit D [Corallococcus sp.]|nr:RnfABCDGE type electron transport complex subunit D [Bacillota bacterium]MCM1533645.1 RnfABCDGE type electron transport complex subunit D [Corallococcus sp.]